ncbi:hypothetical protein LUZ63_006008 [Rhynchospora breviuscula]|uniref:Cyclin N-terminal domain-containing protein n=1 Tax=Rhynchospora breviuscula TaxID=2022672 RepID=A0A9Q0HT60_9POAL|nr:hypothetical protein LUZ63_006008 [Rhynchospora breviuscula]
MALTPDLSASSNLFCAEDAGDIAAWSDARSAPPASSATSAPISDRWALPFSDSSNQFLSTLLASEPDLMPRSDYLSRLRDQSIDATSRQDAVNWMLKVNELFRFRPVTAYLSVSYLDRFLSTHSLPGGAGGWPMQLLSVACVSVAAKVEETHVPLLLELQSLDGGSRFLFESRTVRRMELLLMSALQWRVQGITPFDFLPFFSSDSAFDLFPCASALIVATQRVVDFLAYRPSEIAAAALLCSADKLAGDSFESLCTFDNLIDKESVTGCRQLMEAYLVDTCPSAAFRKRRTEVSHPPPSPIGVLDAAACGSCDSQRSSAPATPSAEPTGAEPPPFKRRRRLDYTGEDGQDLLCND